MALTPHNMADKADQFQFAYFAAMLIMFALVHRLSQCRPLLWFPEASLQMLVGLLVTLLIIHFTGFKNSFNADLFFLILLPPIMFNSGLDVNVKYFYQNFMTIMVFANIGTLINALIVGGLCYRFGADGLSESISRNEAYSFGSLISATDPVTTIAVFDSLRVEPHLYTIVVGVSILDDAVAVILFDMFSKYSSGDANPKVIFSAIGHFIAKLFVSMILGYLSGILFAWYLKKNPQLIRRVPLYLASVVMFVYCSYLIGEASTLSGIITTMFAAISLRKYYERWSPENFAILKHGVNGWSYVFESMVFFNIGLTLVRHRPHGKRDYQFIGWSLFACFVGRVIQIYPLAYLLNLYNSRPVVIPERKPLSWNKSDSMSVDEEQSDITGNATNMNSDTASIDHPSDISDENSSAAQDSSSTVDGEKQERPSSISSTKSSSLQLAMAASTATFAVDTTLADTSSTSVVGVIHPAGPKLGVKYQQVGHIDSMTCYIPPPKSVISSQRQLLRKRGVVLSWGYQHMILFAGLRGPIAYATARLISEDSAHRGMFISATNFTVAVTTFVLGALTVPALHWFDIKYGDAVVEWERKQEEELEAAERLIISNSDNDTSTDDGLDTNGDDSSYDMSSTSVYTGAAATYPNAPHTLDANKRCTTLDYISLKNSWLAFLRLWHYNMTIDEILEICRHYEFELVTRHFIPGVDEDMSDKDVDSTLAKNDIENQRKSLRDDSIQGTGNEEEDLSSGIGISMIPLTSSAFAKHNVSNHNRPRSSKKSMIDPNSAPLSSAAKKRLAKYGSPPTPPPPKPSRKGVTNVALDALLGQEKVAQSGNETKEGDLKMTVDRDPINKLDPVVGTTSTSSNSDHSVQEAVQKSSEGPREKLDSLDSSHKTNPSSNNNEKELPSADNNNPIKLDNQEESANR